MLAKETRFFWIAALTIRLKQRRGADLAEYEDEITELEAIALHSSSGPLRNRAAEIIYRTAEACECLA